MPYEHTAIWSKVTSHNGIEMTLVGTWVELAAYYRGSDGNYWRYSNRRFVNCGPHLGNCRGLTLDNKPINTLERLDDATTSG